MPKGMVAKLRAKERDDSMTAGWWEPLCD